MAPHRKSHGCAANAFLLALIAVVFFVLWTLVSLPMWVWLAVGGIVVLIVLAVRQ